MRLFERPDWRRRYDVRGRYRGAPRRRALPLPELLARLVAGEIGVLEAVRLVRPDPQAQDAALEAVAPEIAAKARLAAKARVAEKARLGRSKLKRKKGELVAAAPRQLIGGVDPEEAAARAAVLEAWDRRDNGLPGELPEGGFFHPARAGRSRW
ncbi:MAG: hypothetical protein ACRD2Z_13150 [Thermoanaerobaculia bacterium]